MTGWFSRVVFSKTPPPLRGTPPQEGNYSQSSDCGSVWLSLHIRNENLFQRRHADFVPGNIRMLFQSLLGIGEETMSEQTTLTTVRLLMHHLLE
jgi:hypothetical protein